MLFADTLQTYFSIIEKISVLRAQLSSFYRLQFMLKFLCFTGIVRRDIGKEFLHHQKSLSSERTTEYIF